MVSDTSWPNREMTDKAGTDPDIYVLLMSKLHGDEVLQCARDGKLYQVLDTLKHSKTFHTPLNLRYNPFSLM